MNKLKRAGIAWVIQYALSIISLFVGAIFILKNGGLNLLTDKDALMQTVQTALPSSLQIFLSLLGIILTVIVFSGFIYLGKKYNKTFLEVMGWLLMIILISNIIFTSLMYNLIPELYLDVNLIYKIIYLIFYIPSIILFGISLLSLKDKVYLSKTTGILYIIGGATSILLVGVFIVIVADISAMVMFFRASQKL